MSIYEQTTAVIAELCEKAAVKPGQTVVVGCSTSEVTGKKIGTNSSMDVAGEIFRALHDYTRAHGIYLAIQCCEHLNRSLVLPRAALEEKGYTEVCAQPWEHAGGSMATAYWQALEEPCLAETICANAGLDIGDTLIGMHLKRVAVPARKQTGYSRPLE